MRIFFKEIKHGHLTDHLPISLYDNRCSNRIFVFFFKISKQWRIEAALPPSAYLESQRHKSTLWDQWDVRILAE